jgi:DNA-binding CsgD family transcriptional regulator
VHRTADVYITMCEAECSRLEGESSAELWEKVAVAWDTMRQPYPAAYARWRMAEALLARRARSGPAAGALREAHATLRRMGAEPLRRQLQALAARAGIDLDEPERRSSTGERSLKGASDEPTPAPPRVSSAEDRLGLTRRELEVLRLVALGRTNREVATTLFISEKTAGVHVSNILRKLDLRSRVEASAYAYRLGLLDEPEN